MRQETAAMRVLVRAQEMEQRTLAQAISRAQRLPIRAAAMEVMLVTAAMTPLEIRLELELTTAR
jgi:hypothetical protein